MAVTKETYTATPTWTPAQLADIFKDAFIDAGLMTNWHDSFLSGSVENRVLRVEYNSAKTYGTTFYWFQFATSGVFLQLATGWNTASDIPSGTQWLDYVTTTTNSANGWQFLVGSTSSTAELVRYTSGVDNQQSWFVFKNNNLSKTFTIQRPETTLQSWLDLDKGSYSGFYHTGCSCGANRPFGVVSFLRGPGLRRDLVVGTALAGSTTASNYNALCASICVCSYGAVGNASNSAPAQLQVPYGFESATGSANERFSGTFILPCNFSGTNPAFVTNSNPVFYSILISPYTTSTLSSDFGLTFHYATNAFSLGDTFVVNPGVEEWEVLDFKANNSAVTGASPLFLARTV